MPRKQKIGDLRGVHAWQNLDSAGDVKRLLRWLILSIRNQTIDPKVAAIMGQLGSFMFKALETSNFEQRLSDLEQTLEERDAGNAGSTAHVH